MKKRICLIICMLSVVLLSGCKKEYINMREDVFKYNVGSIISDKPQDYVRASKATLEQMTIDISNVKPTLKGIYKATVKYGDIVQDFKIQITDLQEPDMKLVRDEFYVEQSESLRLSDVVESVDDLSEFTYGFSNDMRLADQKKQLLEVLSFDEIGNYNCEVLAKDSFDNYTVKGFKVHVVAGGTLPADPSRADFYKKFMNNNKGIVVDDVYTFSMDGVYYGVGNNVDENTNRPNLSYYDLKYGKYKVDFVQPESKYIWLTFNEIIEYGHTEEILNILKEKDVSAVFFITLDYAKRNPELVKRMIDEGHVIGNYTASCANVPELSVNSLTSELQMLYNYIHETYGYDIYLFRPPSGYFSEQALALAGELGYRTVFWSYAYADWDVNNQMDVTEARMKALDRAHGGAIYQLSGSSSTNKEMLRDFIDGIREKNYDFAIYQKIN